MPAQTDQGGLDRYATADLERLGFELFKIAGLEEAKAEATARLLVLADTMGHSTHGMAQAPAYLAELNVGLMTKSGQPEVLKDKGACVLWDGRRLPGLWLTERAVQVAIARASLYGIGTVAIRGSHHIGALSTLLDTAVAQGYMVMVATSDPAARTVAPFGASRGVLSTNPIAFGFPTGGDPILIDMSTAITTAAAAKAHREAGTTLPGHWLVDQDGHPTNQPQKASLLLPLGGTDHGHKGLALSLMVEALTSGLTAGGRADGISAWGANVLVQVWDPDFFAGGAALTAEMSFTTQACRNVKGGPIRLPGEMALQKRRDALINGVHVSRDNIAALEPWAQSCSIALPRPLGVNA